MDILAPLPCSLRQLQYVVAVADLGGFGRAAVHCHVSQPSLSAQVAQAERALGIRVFERDRRGVRLSGAGAALVARARLVLVAAREMADAARHEADPFSGTLRIGVIPTVCPYLLPEITPALSKAYPKMSIAWIEEKTATLTNQLRDGALDGAILALGSPMLGLTHVELTRDPFVLAAAPGHPLMSSSRPIDPARLKGAELLLLADGHCFRNQALALCSTAGAVESGYQATSLATLVQMVATSSTEVTLLPAMAVAVENRRGQLAVRPFARRAPARTLVLAWRRGSAAGTALTAVGKTIRDELVQRSARR